MNKMLQRIKNLFNKEDEFVQEQSLNVVNTWLNQDKIKEKKINRYKEVNNIKSAKEKAQEVETIAGFLKNAKTNFTDDEFKDRKKEILAMLQKMKNKNTER